MRAHELAPYPPAVRRMILRQPRHTIAETVDQLSVAFETSRRRELQEPARWNA